MRFALCVTAAIVAWPASAEIVTPNHLDCNFNETTQALVCPEVPSGRASAGPAEPAATGSVPTPAQGSPEWNAACASKYKSFDPATGMYKSFAGKSRKCV